MGDFGPARKEHLIDIPEQIGDPGELDMPEEEQPVEVPSQKPALVPA